ncbi:MAG TPA: metallophosphoesterase family protein [Prolixibacteraceae bacterium]|nr:metallophosphoesterase family protein [Prolixibacteraceae bacterium]
MEQRKLDVVVLSDIHLATHACRAKWVLQYLKSIAPERMILNGDIFDTWRFSHNYFPKSHVKLVRYLLKMLEKGVKVDYISGNHDEFLRSFSNINLGNLTISDQQVLCLNGENIWIVHGDIFDHLIHKAKWLAKTGAALFGFITIFYQLINILRRRVGFAAIVFDPIFIRRKSGEGKNRLTSFEKAVCSSALAKNCSTVICGHKHAPKDKVIQLRGRSVRYINCGDWVENFTAAEYADQKWSLYHFPIKERNWIEEEPENEEAKEFFPKAFAKLSAACF